MKHKMLLKIKEKVKTQFDAGFLEICVAPDDMEKTTFVTMWRTFCYKVMLFGLKNDGATYQRAMVTLFHELIVKSREIKSHVANL